MGRVNEPAGGLTGNSQAQEEGLVDRLGGNFQQIIGSARDLIGAGVERPPAPARRFVRARAIAFAAIAGVAALALLRVRRPAR